MSHATARPSVDRRILLATDLFTVRDNVCTREDPALSPETAPLPFNELAVPLSGVWVLRSGRREAAFCPGTAHLLPSGLVYRADHPCGCGGDRNLGVEFADDVLEHLGARSDGSLRSRRSLTARQVAVAWSLHRALTFGADNSVAAEEAILAFLTALAPGAEPSTLRSPVTARAHAAIVSAVEQVLASRFAEPLTLRSIARAAHSSPFHMSRVFRAHTGRSVGERLRAVRLAAAIERLVETDHSLSRIAADVGFTDAPHLVRSFHAALAITPGRFRTELSTALLRRSCATLDAPLKN